MCCLPISSPREVQLNPVWVMFAIAAFGYLFGFVGLLIAVPLVAAIGVVIRFTTRQYHLAQLVPAAAPAPVVSAPDLSDKERPASGNAGARKPEFFETS